MSARSTNFPAEPRNRVLAAYADLVIYSAIGLCLLASALLPAYFANADVVAYLDIAQALRQHLWHAAFNSYWFPLYPALVALAESAIGHGLRYELLAARLAVALSQILFVLASVVLTHSVRRYSLSRGTAFAELMDSRSLYLWTCVFSYCFVGDLNNIAPDCLLSALLILLVALFLHALVTDNLLYYAAAGLVAALAYLTKAFAFPFFLMCILFLGIACVRHIRTLRGLAASVVVFALIAGPYMSQISKDKGRFTFGDSGRLVSSWYVNGADRFDPVADATVYKPGMAQMHLKHPGELLSRVPEIDFYSGPVYGSQPQWDDPSYWQDGLAPRFVARQTLVAIKTNTIALFQFVAMRLQAWVFLLLLPAFGFVTVKKIRSDRVFIAISLLFAAAVAMYLLVLLEGRYVAFAFAAIGIVYAASAQRLQVAQNRSMYTALLLMAALTVSFTAEGEIRSLKTSAQKGASPFHGIYDLPTTSVGAALSSLYAPGTDVACVGDEACWGDPYWARLGHVRITGYIDTSHGVGGVPGSIGCAEVDRHPEVLDRLRQHGIRSLVTRLDHGESCSAQWKPLGETHDFFYLPL